MITIILLLCNCRKYPYTTLTERLFCRGSGEVIRPHSIPLESPILLYSLAFPMSSVEEEWILLLLYFLEPHIFIAKVGITINQTYKPSEIQNCLETLRTVTSTFGR